MEDGALERAQQVLAEGEREDLVGREGHVAEAEGLEEAVEDAAVALLGDHREAGLHQRVEIAVDGAAHAAELVGQVVEADARSGCARAAGSAATGARAGRPASADDQDPRFARRGRD